MREFTRFLQLIREIWHEFGDIFLKLSSDMDDNSIIRKFPSNYP